MKLFRILLLAFLLVSCAAQPAPTTSVDSQPQPTQTQQASGYPAAGQPAANQPAADANAGYPAPAAAATQSGYPAPEDAAANPIPTIALPTRDPSLSMIKGRILENGKPLPYADLYLADLLVNEEGKEVAFSFDRATSPRAQSNENGEFVFVNIPQGQYGLVYDIIVKSVLLLNPKTGEQMKLIIEPGKDLDAGDLDYTDLPKS